MRRYNKGVVEGAREDFRERVFRATRKIPYGKVTTYKNIAVAIGSPRAVRAVGNALNKNRSAQVPCHRVVRSDGGVGGYAHGQRNKILVLKKEGILIENKKLIGKHFFYLIK